MKSVLLDQGLAPNTAALLRAVGWDAVHVTEVGLATAEDAAILEFARQNGRTCVTLDHDFHTHLALSAADGPSVIFVRIEGLNAVRQAELIEAVWASCEDAIADGAAVSVNDAAIRIKRLPLR